MNLMDYGFEHSVKHVLEAEKGYVNHVNDRGGETNLGITKDTALRYQYLWAKHGWDGNMRTLPVSLAKEIYKVGYWDKVKGDEIAAIHPVIADHLFDLAVNGGVARAGMNLQEALNLLNSQQRDYNDIVVDGSIGKVTIDALRAYANKRGKKGLDRLAFMLVCMQCELYLNICRKNSKQEDFMNGWVSRFSSKMDRYAEVLEP